MQHRFTITLHFVYQGYKYFYYFFDPAHYGSLHGVIQSMPINEIRAKAKTDT